MKKMFSLSLALLLSLALCAGCMAQGDAFTQDQALDMAQQVADALAHEDYAWLVAQFDETMAAQVNEDLLRQAWQAQLEALGPYQRAENAQAAQAQGGYSVQAQLLHQAGQQVLLLTFDEAGKISGMLLRPQPQAQPHQALPQGVTERQVTLFPGEARELGGTLLLPDDPAPGMPAALLMQGSGASDRDETVGPNKPFRDIALALAERGVASLRFDKITYAHPELFMGGSYTVEMEYLQPVAEALRVLEEEAPGHQVFLIGHSQGGMLAPWLMHNCPQLAGGVLLAGSPRQLWQIQVDQNLAVIDTLPQAQREENLALVRAEVEKAQSLLSLSPQEVEQITVFGLPGPYAYSLAQIDAAALARGNQKPLLILQGQADVQVSLTDFEGWRTALGEGELYTYRLYPNLSHLFTPSKPGLTFQEAMAEYMEPMAVDAQALSDIGDWILRQAA